MSLSKLFSQLKISYRLSGGFAIIVLLLVAAVGFTVFQVNIIKTRNDRIVELRMPTAKASAQMMNDINASLAALRGYMLTGNNLLMSELCVLC